MVPSVFFAFQLYFKYSCGTFACVHMAWSGCVRRNLWRPSALAVLQPAGSPQQVRTVAAPTRKYDSVRQRPVTSVNRAGGVPEGGTHVHAANARGCTGRRRAVHRRVT